MYELIKKDIVLNLAFLPYVLRKYHRGQIGMLLNIRLKMIDFRCSSASKNTLIACMIIEEGIQNLTKVNMATSLKKCC